MSPVSMRWVALVAAMLVVAACGGIQQRLEHNLPVAAGAVERLGEQLDRGRIRNAALIASYASTVASRKPELRELTAVLRKEGTRDGNLYQGLVTRVADARRQAGSSASSQEKEALLLELGRIVQAADFEEFNRASRIH